MVLDNLITGRRENVPGGALFLERDLREPGLDEILREERVDVVSHHAAQANVRVSVEQPLADAEANVLGGLALIEACRRAGVRRFLFASSGGTVYGEQEAFPCDEGHPLRPLSPYGCSKLAVELYLGAYARLGDLEPVVLRYANVYGPRQDPKGEAGHRRHPGREVPAPASRPKIFGDGAQTRDYVHVARRRRRASRRRSSDWVPRHLQRRHRARDARSTRSTPGSPSGWAARREPQRLPANRRRARAQRASTIRSCCADVRRCPAWTALADGLAEHRAAGTGSARRGR